MEENTNQVVYTGCLALHKNEEGITRACIFFTVRVDDKYLDKSTGLPTPEGFQNAHSAIVYLDDLKWVKADEVTYVPRESITNSADVWRMTFPTEE